MNAKSTNPTGSSPASPPTRPAAARRGNGEIPLGSAQPDPLTTAIAGLPIERPAPSFQSPRLRNALERFRWFICGTFGVLREDVSDAHIAALIERGVRDFAFMYRNFPGVGLSTQEELAAWAGQQRREPGSYDL
jgi:hypothetical protein